MVDKLSDVGATATPGKPLLTLYESGKLWLEAAVPEEQAGTLRIGKTYGNEMVDVDALKNKKLVDRGARMISRLTGVDREAALALLDAAGGKVKRAVVMQRKGCDVFTADNWLTQAGGRLRDIIGDVPVDGAAVAE